MRYEREGGRSLGDHVIHMHVQPIAKHLHAQIAIAVQVLCQPNMMIRVIQMITDLGVTQNQPGRAA